MVMMIVIAFNLLLFYIAIIIVFVNYEQLDNFV